MKKITALILSIAFLLTLVVTASTPIDKLKSQVENIRGIKFLHPLVVKEVSSSEMKAELKREMDSEYSPEEWSKMEATLKVFGFIPPKMRLRKVVTALMEEQAAGLYDPDKKVLFVVKTPLNVEGLEGLPLGNLNIVDIMLSHEMDHALTDQHFDLKRLQKYEKTNEDRASAARCVAEGDATWVMIKVTLNSMNVKEDDNGMMDNMARMMGVGTDMMGNSAPAYITQNLLIGYLGGLNLVVKAYKKGGTKAIDELYRNPPQSMEQVLHSDKYFKGDDPPLKVSCDVTEKLKRDGWKTLFKGTWGEFNIRILLEEWGVTKEQAEQAAAGWGGDCYRVLYKKNSPDAFLWVTEWDTPHDAAEFARAAEAGKDISVTLKDRRVTLQKIQMPAETGRKITN